MRQFPGKIVDVVQGGKLHRQCPPFRAFTLPSQGAEMATKPAMYLCLHTAHNTPSMQQKSTARGDM